MLVFKFNIFFRYALEFLFFFFLQTFLDLLPRLKSLMSLHSTDVPSQLYASRSNIMFESSSGMKIRKSTKNSFSCFPRVIFIFRILKIYLNDLNDFQKVIKRRALLYVSYSIGNHYEC